jgi:nitrite reductase/ring-hydroxylating ferredoxin subunit
MNTGSGLPSPGRFADVAGTEPALPYPAGWFCVAFSRELPRSSVLTSRCAGEDIVLYRTQDGVARAVHPYCPHLGAHLGAGGTVEGQLLICPFHRFAFAPDGACVRTPAGPPPRARVDHWPLRERNGMLFAWYSHDGAPPAWDLPEALGGHGEPVTWWVTDVSTHPQEIIENIVDYRHLSALHGQLMTQVSAPEPDGPYLRLRLRLRPESFPRAGDPFGDQAVLLAGLGILCAELPLPRLGALFHLWSLPTPIGPWRSRLRFATACTLTGPRRLPGPRLPALDRPLAWAMARGVHKLALKVLKQDIPIWNSKRYQPHPRLASDDDAIGRYRHWARQFYPPA